MLVGLLFRLTWSGVGFCEISVIDSKSHPTWNTESIWSCALKQSTNLDVNESSAGVLSSLPQAARSSLVFPGPFDLLAAPAQQQSSTNKMSWLMTESNILRTSSYSIVGPFCSEKLQEVRCSNCSNNSKQFRKCLLTDQKRHSVLRQNWWGASKTSCFESIRGHYNEQEIEHRRFPSLRTSQQTSRAQESGKLAIANSVWDDCNLNHDSQALALAKPRRGKSLLSGQLTLSGGESNPSSYL